MEYGLSSSTAHGIFLDQGSNLCLLHWQADSFITEPPGKPSFSRFLRPLGFPGNSAGKEFACNAGDLGSIPGFGRSPGEGKGYPLQYSGLKKSMDYIVHGVTKSRTQLSNFHFKPGTEPRPLQ